MKHMLQLYLRLLASRLTRRLAPPLSLARLSAPSGCTPRRRQHTPPKHSPRPHTHFPAITAAAHHHQTYSPTNANDATPADDPAAASAGARSDLPTRQARPHANDPPPSPAGHPLPTPL